MNNGFLGTGWMFGLDEGAEGLGLDGAGRIAEVSGEESVRQAIWLLLSTAPGERIGRPSYGCGIHDLVFAPRSAGTMGAAIRAVEGALGRWEPRIDVISVDASPHPHDPAGLLIEVRYLIRATNSRQNLVYPFYLAV